MWPQILEIVLSVIYLEEQSPFVESRSRNVRNLWKILVKDSAYTVSTKQTHSLHLNVITHTRVKALNVCLPSLSDRDNDSQIHTCSDAII